jgi:DGQHR domain-containing protein
MKIPYIKIKQRGEVFFVTKINANIIKHKINFHFRDPYLKLQDETHIENTNQYIQKIKKKGIELKSDSEGIQRRLQVQRIKDIKEYVESSSSNFFPNSILLSVDATKINNFDKDYEKYENSEIGYFELPDDTKFTVIDGQHRLAGLFMAGDKIINDFEIVAILLFNISLSTAAKLFADINGKQKPVNRSLIYDLYSQINTKEIENMKNFHTIAQKFYTDENSPLFRQIKMLGIGRGAISQAFFIDYVKNSIEKTDLINLIDNPNNFLQEIYNQLFFYFKSFQKVFPNDWPVPQVFKDYQELDDYAEKVLKIRKSQLVKTNGFGAIVRLFPEIYKNSNKSFNSYLEIISKLHNFDWVQKEFTGTGKQLQNDLLEKMRNNLGL